jgi:methylated-DNA-[protein]-cysteine S-methyltransferase
MTTTAATIATPLGQLVAITSDAAVTALYFPEEAPAAAHDDHRDNGLVDQLRAQLAAYFAGALTKFDLPLAPRGTPFQQRVWSALREIPYGATVSYRSIAERIGKPSAVHAVGAANGRNPIPILIPCHRVIAADGTLGGYSGGLARKNALLKLESAGKRGAAIELALFAPA